MTLDEALVVSPRSGRDLVTLDDALHALEVVHPRKSQVVEMRFVKLWPMRELSR